MPDVGQGRYGYEVAADFTSENFGLENGLKSGTFSQKSGSDCKTRDFPLKSGTVDSYKLYICN